MHDTSPALYDAGPTARFRRILPVPLRFWLLPKTSGLEKAPVENDPTRICQLLVGLPAGKILGVCDELAERRCQPCRDSFWFGLGDFAGLLFWLVDPG